MNPHAQSGNLGHLMPALLVAFIVAIVAGPAFGQGFMVKPMRLEADPRAGRSIEIPLQIRNTAGDGPRVIDLRLVELSQNVEGSWKLVEPSADVDLSNLASAREWTTLSESRVEIAPLAPAEITVRVNPPASARGAYFAGIVAETPLPDVIRGVVVRMRFLIPLIVEIQGRAVRQEVVLEDVAMTYQEAEGSPATTEAHLRIANLGRTFSRVAGQMRIDRLSNGRWRQVTRFEIDERSIIPGMTLELGRDLRRRLPSGTYRLRGEMKVDGRRIAPLEKEIEFVGDSNMDALAYDTALILEPELVEMTIAPGATRTTIVKVENPGADPVMVHIVSDTPRSLAAVELGTLRGIDLSAEPWTEIRPSEFEIRPGRWQNVRVISRIPREGVDHPNYYASLTLQGSYEDGQSAGETRSTVHLVNTAIRSVPDGAIEQLSLAEGDSPTQFVVQMRFVNTGNVHLEPSARALLLRAQGGQVQNQELFGDEGALLPLGKRIYSAELDFGGVAPGYYALRSIATIAPGMDITEQRIVLVDTEPSTNDDGNTVMVPRVTLIDPSDEQLGSIEASFGDGAAVEPDANDRGTIDEAIDEAGTAGAEGDACGDSCAAGTP